MFEIGQKVVCVRSHSQGLVKEGETYNVFDLKLCENCKNLDVNIGLRSNRKYLECGCGDFEESKGVLWLNHKLFKPLDDLYNEEIKELMQEVYEKQPFEL